MRSFGNSEPRVSRPAGGALGAVGGPNQIPPCVELAECQNSPGKGLNVRE